MGTLRAASSGPGYAGVWGPSQGGASDQVSWTTLEGASAPSTAMRRSVPAATWKITWLEKLSPASSSAARGVREARDSPAYTASFVSKLLPEVWIVATPSADGAHLHHTVLPAAPGPCEGSPGSVVARWFVA